MVTIVRTPFELFIGFTGCGYTYCNKVVAPGADYKKLAFVDAYTGDITWYVAQRMIPGYVLLRIEHDADAIVKNRKGDKVNDR